MSTRQLVTTYEDDQKLFTGFWPRVGLAVATLLCLAFPFAADGYWLSIGNEALIAIVGALGMMILTGFAGQISLGHAAFLALGAYTAGIGGAHFGLPFWLGLPAGGLVAALVGLAVGPFALRLRGLYLAIVTLGLLFLVEHTLVSFPAWTGGISGLSVPMHGWFAKPGATGFGSFGREVTIGPVTLGFEQKLYFLYLLIAAVSTLATKNIQRSNTGRAMLAVRDHDLAAAVLGVDPAKTKVVAFGVSSFFAGLAGAMFAYKQQFITPSPPFNLAMSVDYIAIVVLGGIGTTFGAVSGAIAFVTLGPLAEVIGQYIPLLNQLSSGQQSTVLFAIIVITFLIVEPLGLYGIWQRIKRYFAAWPFSY
ncbi:MAG: branched-chain amino acid ABC transporter permease [Bradymonadaceae bacterium]